MGILEDVMKALDRIPSWKRIQQLPSEVDALEKRIKDLEGRLKPATGNQCPSCRAMAYRLVKSTPSPEPWGSMGGEARSFRVQFVQLHGCEGTQPRRVKAFTAPAITTAMSDAGSMALMLTMSAPRVISTTPLTSAVISVSFGGWQRGCLLDSDSGRPKVRKIRPNLPEIIRSQGLTSDLPTGQPLNRRAVPRRDISPPKPCRNRRLNDPTGYR